MRVLDLACGSGDIVRALARRARRQGIVLDIAGCDVSPRAVQVARAGGSAEFFVSDVLGDGFPGGYDVYLSSLFMHHLRDDNAVELLRRMATGRAFLLSDLRRTRIGYLLARCGTPFITRSPVVRNDAPVSVHNAYSIPEAGELLSRAGVVGARIDKQWPQRYLISWGR